MGSRGTVADSGRRFPPEALLIFLTMLPVTGVIPILKSFVMDGFQVSELSTHLFLSFNMVSAFLFAPFVGAMADRFAHPRQFLIMASVIDGAIFFFMPHVTDFKLLMGLRFIEGISHISVLSLLLAMASGREHSTGRSTMGLVGASLTFGVALGSPLGGYLGELSVSLALSVGGGIMLLTALLSQTMLSPHFADIHPPRLSAVLSTLFQVPGLRLPYIFAFLDRFTVGFFVGSFPLFAVERFNMSSGRIGLMIAAFMLTMGLLCWPVVKLFKRFTPRSLMLWGSLFYGLLFSGIGWIGESGFLLWMVLLGAASSLMFIPTLTLTSRSAPDWARTTAMGGFTSAGSLGFLLGPIVSGVLFTLFRPAFGVCLCYSYIFVIGGLIEIIAVLIVFAIQSIKPGIQPKKG